MTMPAEREERPVPRGEKAPGVPVDLRDDGFLWLINTVVFHPRGFALAWNRADGNFTLMGNGLERWAFAEEGQPANDDLWQAAEAAFKRAADENRE